MSLFRIIKASEVQENITQVLPLRYSMGAVMGDINEDSINDEAETVGNIKSEAAAEAEAIVSQARVEAEEIIHKARLLAEQSKQKAYQDGFVEGRQAGYETGYNTGYQDGAAKADEEAATLRQQAKDVVAQAEDIRHQTLADMEPEIIDLAKEIAEKLLSAQLTLEPGMVLQVAEEALRLVAERVNAVLYINPSEVPLVESRQERLLGVLPAGAQLRVIADPQVQPGGCKVETEQGCVDATMETRQKELTKVLYGHN